MKTEFNLSKKMLRCDCGNDNENRRLLLHSKDVKEFIERLKATAPKDEIDSMEYDLIKEIDELAGNKLI